MLQHIQNFEGAVHCNISIAQSRSLGVIILVLTSRKCESIRLFQIAKIQVTRV